MHTFHACVDKDLDSFQHSLLHHILSMRLC